MQFGERVSHTFLLGENNREVPLVNNWQVGKKKAGAPRRRVRMLEDFTEKCQKYGVETGIGRQ